MRDENYGEKYGGEKYESERGTTEQSVPRFQIFMIVHYFRSHVS